MLIPLAIEDETETDDDWTCEDDDTSLTDTDSWITHNFDVIMLQQLRDSDADDEELSLTTSEDRDLRVPEECRVCFDVVRLNRRPCCGLPVCQDCLETYVQTKLVSEGVVRIACPNPACDRAVYQDQVRELLRSSDELRGRYERWLVDKNANPHRKTCPRCCHITQVEPSRLKGRCTAKRGLLLECSECQFQWCFSCQAPWHEGRTCERYNKEHRAQLKNWARQRTGSRHDYNAQRCPKCKVLFVTFRLHVILINCR